MSYLFYLGAVVTFILAVWNLIIMFGMGFYDSIGAAISERQYFEQMVIFLAVSGGCYFLSRVLEEVKKDEK